MGAILLRGKMSNGKYLEGSALRNNVARRAYTYYTRRTSWRKRN